MAEQVELHLPLRHSPTPALLPESHVPILSLEKLSSMKLALVPKGWGLVL